MDWYPSTIVTVDASCWAAHGWRSLAVDVAFFSIVLVIALFLYPSVSSLIDYLAGRHGDD